MSNEKEMSLKTKYILDMLEIEAYACRHGEKVCADNIDIAYGYVNNLESQLNKEKEKVEKVKKLDGQVDRFAEALLKSGERIKKLEDILQRILNKEEISIPEIVQALKSPTQENK